MDRQRVLILGVAAVAAAAVAFLARGLLGGGTPKSAAATAPMVATSQILVSTGSLAPGVKLAAGQVRWQDWPKTALDASYITHETAPNLPALLKDAVVRAPLVSGEPITSNNIVHSDAAGFMAATLTPGMRAVSVGISTETGAGGFILPNDRVDVMTTRVVSDSPRRFGARTVLADVRVLAVDQTFKEDANQKTVLAKTATLEVTPRDAKKLEAAQAAGTLSLGLRSLAGEQPPAALADAANKNQDADQETQISVIGYGVTRVDAGPQKE